MTLRRPSPREQLCSLLDTVSVRAEDAYTWLGQTVRGEVARDLPLRVYADFYLSGGPAPVSGPRHWRLDLARGGDTERLSGACPPGVSPQEGWVVRGRAAGRIIVERDGLRLMAAPSEIAGGGDGDEQSAVTLLLPRERRDAAGGFYTVMGAAGSGAEAEDIDRLYWNLRPSGAPAFVEAVSRALDAHGIPFRMKVINDERGYGRCDVAVLYTQRADRDRAVESAREVHGLLAAEMRPAIPSLTLALAPGLAFAEDPGGGESFGSHRSRLLGDAILRAWRRGVHDLNGRLAVIEARFRDAGLDVDRPHLGPAAGSPRAEGAAT